MKTLLQLHTETTIIFQDHFQCLLSEAQSMSEWLIRDTLKLTPLQWMSRSQLECPPSQEREVQSWRERMIHQKCSLARLRGVKEFWGHPFHLNSETLEPRWETEGIILLVQEYFSPHREKLISSRHISLPHGKHSPTHVGPDRILDLGTGSGCLLISLLKEHPQACGVGVDISLGALQMAQTNASALGVSDRSQWIQGSWLEKVQGKFDCIVSNPPYIPQDATLEDVVRLWDPDLALYAGKEGLDAYHQIIPSLSHFLTPEGVAIMEIGEAQSHAVLSLLRDYDFTWACVVDDLTERPRYVMTGIHESSYERGMKTLPSEEG